LPVQSGGSHRPPDWFATAHGYEGLSSQNKRATIRILNVIWPALAITGCVTVLLVLMQTLSDAQFVWRLTFTFDAFGTPISSTARCETQGITDYFEGLLQAVQIAILLLAA